MDESTIESSSNELYSEELYNKLGRKYEEAYVHDAGLHKNLEKYLGLLPADARILDCGCGTGKPVSSTIAESGRRVQGIDLSSGMIELSRKQVPKGSFEKVDMLLYDPGPGSFNGVIACLSLFERTREELTSMAQKYFEWLQPGGLVLINTISAEDCECVTPEMYDPDGQCARNVPWMFLNNKCPATLLTKAGWNGLLEKAGFERVHTDTDLFVPRADPVCYNEPRYYVIARKPSKA